MIRVNGEELDYSDISLKDFLEEKGYHLGRIAVECNEIIVPKSQFETFILHSGDVVEIVSFVGGG
ncbi:MAG: sulfur carrier protein ThiS [Eubacteriales bacterium]|nr:sulfur carrier protein ThiS [Eubacteriales bacterium]